MKHQLGLGLSLPDDCRFENFLPVPGVTMAVSEFLRTDFGANVREAVYLWGPSGGGRSHLMLALCQDWLTRDRRVQYLPLAELLDFPPAEVLADLQALDLVCLDDIHLVAGRSDWLEQLFHFYNRAVERGVCLLVSADCAPGDLALALPDLQSRLGAALIFHLPGYSDTEKLRILQFRARCLGLELSDEAGQFLINRAPRQLVQLTEKLRQLDRASLVHQRRLTVPFIKHLFGW